ncbi:MAG: hypothetical protein WCY49_07065 [Anaerovoracaceae bacterium]
MLVLKIENGQLKATPLKIENISDVDTTARAEATLMIWDATASKYKHAVVSGGGSTGSNFIRLKQYTFTESDLTTAETNGYLDVPITSFGDVNLAVKDTHIDNGLQVIVGRFSLYPGVVADGGDYELVQGAADPGYADTIRIHKDWVVDAGEGVWGYLV